MTTVRKRSKDVSLDGCKMTGVPGTKPFRTSASLEFLFLISILRRLALRPNLQSSLAVDACVSTLFGDPCEEILKYAKEHNLDFIVMGSHGRKGLNRVLIGSTTVSVVRHSQVPVVTLFE